MLRREVALRFTLRFVLVYAFCVAPWPGLKSVTSGLFRSIGQSVARVWLGDNVRFLHTVDPGVSADVEVVIRKGQRLAHVQLESRTIAFLPLAFFTALVVATPLPKRQSILIWGLGCGALVLLAAFRTTIPIVLSASDVPDAVLKIPAWLRALYEWLERATAQRSATGFVAAVFVWAALVHRSLVLPQRWKG